LLEPGDVLPSSTALEASVEEPNPYERLRLGKADLLRRIEVQRVKRRSVEAERLFVEGQLATESTLGKALATDLSLAQAELAIAEAQANSADGWGQFWSLVEANAADKVEKISGEVDYAQVRQRAREVELGLGESQVTFRQERISELQSELESVSGFDSLAIATWETLTQWLMREAWKVVLSLVLIYFAVRFAQRLLARSVKVILSRTDDDPDSDDDGDQRRETLADVFLSVARIAIYVVAALIALEQIGVNTGPIMGSVAILGLAISFGSQNLVRDVVNGFFILLENQFAVGDVVTINGKTGSVEKISIRSTWIRQATGDLHVIPNGGITVVSNLTRGWSKATCEIGVSYNADLAQVKEVINAVGEIMYADEAWREQLDEAPQWIGVTSLGDSSVVVRTQVKVTPGSQWAVTRELNHRLKLAFDEAGIEIPYPHQVVHHVNA
jgi:small-conductance mechanosensitive channel